MMHIVGVAERSSAVSERSTKLIPFGSVPVLSVLCIPASAITKLGYGRAAITRCSSIEDWMNNLGYVL